MAYHESCWKGLCTEVSYQEFWDEATALPPIKRMGFADGPGASFNAEPYSMRICSATGKKEYTHSAHFVLCDAENVSHYYRLDEPITLAEFKALCAIIIPGVGPCSWGYGKDL